MVILRIADSETLAKCEFTPAILFLLGGHIIHSVGGKQYTLDVWSRRKQLVLFS